MENPNNKKGKILQFRQDSSFHLKRGDRHMEKNDPIQAVSHYRKAYEKNPNDPEVCMALADQLNVLHRYDESNRILFVYMEQHNAPADFFFGLACNFFGLCEYEYATDALYTYLQMDPDGQYAAEASEFLDVLEDDEALADTIGLDDDEDFDVVTLSRRVQNLIESNEYDVAEFLLRSQINEGEDAWRIESLHAYTVYLMGSHKKGENLMKKVYEKNPGNLSVRVDYIRMLSRCNKKEAALEILSGMEMNGCTDAAVWKNLAEAQYDLGMKKEALVSAREADALLPYDRDILHLIGFICHEMDDYDTAISCYTTLQKIEPDDVVSSFYLSSLREEKTKGKRKDWCILYAIPITETVQWLNQVLDTLYASDIKDRWQDRDFRNLMNWALVNGTQEIRYMIIDFYAQMKDEMACRALMDYVLRMDQKDEDKKYALLKLNFIVSKPPYMAYLDSQWMESNLSAAPFPEDMPSVYKTSMEHMLVCFDELKYEKNMSDAAMYIFQGFLNRHMGEYPKLSINQTDALMGAIHSFACELTNTKITRKEILDMYALTPVRFENALKLLVEEPEDLEEDY